MRKYPLDIILACQGMAMAGDTISKGDSLGGSETAALQLSSALAAQGHHVTLFCNTEKKHKADGVIFQPMGWVNAANNAGFPKGFFDCIRSTPHDVLCVMRLPALLQFETAAKMNVLWQHDLATHTGPSNFRPVVWNVDRIFVLSEFMKKQYQGVHGGSDKLYTVTRNGIDLGLIDAVPEQPRDRFKLMFTARPERGLDIMLRQVWPEILKREPRAKLYISRYADPATLPLYNELAELAKQFGDSIVNLGNLGKADLYKHYKQARLLLYSSVFEEISCLSAVEAAGCRLPFIGPWKAALPETCAGNHVLIRDDGSIGQSGDPLDAGFKAPTPDFLRSFVDETIDLIHDDDRWNKISSSARARAEQWTWGPVAEQWSEVFHEILEQKTSEPRRLVKHFLFNSDVVAAQKYVEKNGAGNLKLSVQRYIDKFVPFMNEQGPEQRKLALGKFYEQRSGGDQANYQVAFWADTEPRLQLFLKWLKQHEGDVRSVLDFGCAHGGYVRAISNISSALHVLGMDVSPSLIRCCNELKRAQMPDGKPAFQHPQNVDFAVGDEDTPIEDHATDQADQQASMDSMVTRQFDCVLAMEMLEHLPDPAEVAQKLERHCKPGGWMVFTVPVGHRERDELVTKGIPPVHVHSFDQHDLVELFGHREGFELTCFSDMMELPLDRTFAGWLMVAYKKDDKRVEAIDYERKFAVQGPRETVTVCMIVNNSEDIMHRCLRSVQKIADQVIILDNGPSTDRTVDVASEYTEEVYAGTSPFWCYAHKQQHHPGQILPGVCNMAGFETPRNESVEHAWGDWILWIDSDEQLLEWRSLFKYLRSNTLLGYAMPQHHIAVDPPGELKKDIPVRLYRNRARMKFYGLVHEHAELGINKGVGADCLLINDVHIHHDGYLTETIRRNRFHRNIKLLECDRIKYPERLLGLFLYDIRDQIHMANYAMESNGNRMTPEIAAYLNKVVETFRKHFLRSEIQVLSEDSLKYYSEALARLGQGLEVSVAVDVKPVNSQIPPPTKFRAANEEEAQIIIRKMVQPQFAQFQGPYVG